MSGASLFLPRATRWRARCSSVCSTSRSRADPRTLLSQRTSSSIGSRRLRRIGAPKILNAERSRRNAMRHWCTPSACRLSRAQSSFAVSCAKEVAHDQLECLSGRHVRGEAEPGRPRPMLARGLGQCVADVGLRPRVQAAVDDVAQPPCLARTGARDRRTRAPARSRGPLRAAVRRSRRLRPMTVDLRLVGFQGSSVAAYVDVEDGLQVRRRELAKRRRAGPDRSPGTDPGPGREPVSPIRDARPGRNPPVILMVWTIALPSDRVRRLMPRSCSRRSPVSK